jgi:hypothetical protein
VSKKYANSASQGADESRRPTLIKVIFTTVKGRDTARNEASSSPATNGRVCANHRPGKQMGLAFYDGLWTSNGACVGDLFMSLIHTASWPA